jgi:hypothetical protein
VEALGNLLALLLMWLCGWFRDWLDRMPDRDPSMLPLWHRMARVALAVAVCLAFFAPYVWIVLKIQGRS